MSNCNIKAIRFTLVKRIFHCTNSLFKKHSKICPLFYDWPVTHIWLLTRYTYFITDPLHIFDDWPVTHILWLTRYTYFMTDPLHIFYDWPVTHIVYDFITNMYIWLLSYMLSIYSTRACMCGYKVQMGMGCFGFYPSQTKSGFFTKKRVIPEFFTKSVF